MAENQNVFVFIASYGSVDDAMMDYSAVQQLYIDGAIDTYDAAVVQKDIDGNVHVSKHEKPTQKGAWTGIAAGAVVGLLFPPPLSRWRPLEVSRAESSATSGTACRART